VLTTHPLSVSTNRMGGHRAQGRADVKPRHGIHEYPGQCGRQFQPARHVGRHPAGLHLDDPSRDAVGNLSAERCGAVASGPFREGVGTVRVQAGPLGARTGGYLPVDVNGHEEQCQRRRTGSCLVCRRTNQENNLERPAMATYRP